MPWRARACRSPRSRSVVVLVSSRVGAGGGEQGHGLLGEVAPVGFLPLVVTLDQDAGREAHQRVGVGEDPDDVGAALDLTVEPLDRYLLSAGACL